MACIATAFDPFWLTGVFAGADCPTVARRTSARVVSLNGAGAEGGVAAAFCTVETVSEVKAEEVAARPATIASFVATARERFITCPSKKLHPDGPPGFVRSTSPEDFDMKLSLYDKNGLNRIRVIGGGAPRIVRVVGCKRCHKSELTRTGGRERVVRCVIVRCITRLKPRQLGVINPGLLSR